MKLKTGDVIDNGFYKIQLSETPRWSDEKQRWFAYGYRWLKTYNDWEGKCKLYGWDQFHNIKVN